MQVLVFTTTAEDGSTTGPTLFVPDRPGITLPPHPRSLEWKYFATIDDRDDLLAQSPGAVEVIERQGYFIDNRLI